jgi:hypothetical protein
VGPVFDDTNPYAGPLRRTDKVLVSVPIYYIQKKSVPIYCHEIFSTIFFLNATTFLLELKGKPEKERVPGSLLGVEVFIFQKCFFFLLIFGF